MREDLVRRSEAKATDLGSSEEREALLNEAPHRVDDFIAVKKIIEQ
jgi:Asp-tRNA(Asn)/Glu-tRNA(Gln) amidotransferase C subunit